MTEASSSGKQASCAMSGLHERNAVKMFGGWVRQYSHESSSTQSEMKFSVYLPPAADSGKVPVLYWLSGLTCTDENFLTKAGAQRVAAELGIMLVMPDTSPRGLGIEGEDDSYDFGSGAGFYVDATEPKWAKHYNMYSYVTKELLELVNASLPADPERSAIFGHSMGGHGALVCFLANPGKYRSVSAFAPICHPSACPWGEKAFTGYLGADRAAWAAYDATELARSYDGPAATLLVHQGTADNFYKQGQLLPEDLAASAAENGKVGVDLRMGEGYDHSYYFIATFVEEHIRFHAEALKA